MNPPSLPASPQSDSLRGIAFKSVGTIAVAAVGALVKALAPHYPLGEIVFFRSFFMLIPVLIMMAQDRRGFALLRSHRPWAHVRRSAVGVLAIVMTFLALRYLPLADATALTFSSPLFLLAIAKFGGDRIGPYRTGAAVVGFLGVILTALPHLGGGLPGGHATLGVMIALASAVFIAFAQLALRALREEPAVTTVLYFTLAMTGASMLTLPFAFRWPANPADLVMLISVGLVGGLAQLLITHSYRYAEATVLAPFDYLQLVWALIFGYAFFGEVPVALVIAGALIIAASSTFISMRERALARLARASSPDGAV